MPLSLTTAQEDALDAGRISVALLFEFFLTEGTMRAVNQRHDLSFESVTWTGLGDAIVMGGGFSSQMGLVSDAVSIAINSSLSESSGSFVNTFLSRTWHGRAVRVRQMLFVPDGSFLTVIGSNGISELNGVIEEDADYEGSGRLPVFSMTIGGGLRRLQEKELRIYSDAEQRERSASDGFFKNMATKMGQSIPFGGDWSSIPGARSGGGSAGGGTGLTGNTLVIR